MEKIKVLHLVESLNVGGMENGVVNIANNIDRSRFDLKICCFSHKGELSKKLKEINSKPIELGYGPGLHMAASFKLAKLFRSENVQIVHTHGWGARSLLGFIGAKLGRIPFCLNGEHGVLHIDTPIRFQLQKYLSSKFDGTLSVSEGLKQKLISRLGLSEKDITVIPNGVDISRFHGNYPVDELREEFQIKKDSFTLGVVGTLKSQKNQKIVIKALELLKREGYDAKVIFVGDGPDKDFLSKLAADRGVREEVLFLGVRDDLPKLYTLMDALVLPSIPDHEGMSNVILEAMASKVPVVSTESVGTKELIKDTENGFLFYHDQPNSLKEKIIILLENLELREFLIRNAREKIFQCYSLEVMIKKYEDYYWSLLSKRNLPNGRSHFV